MAQRMVFEVSFMDATDEKTVKVRMFPKDSIAFEKKYGKSMASIGEDLTVEQTCEWVYGALKRQNLYPGTFEQFEEDLTDLSPSETGDEHPLVPGAPKPEDSSPSPTPAVVSPTAS